MSGSRVTEFFFRFAMRRTRAADLDEALEHSPATLDILFLWGRDGPNCGNAKRAILAAPARFLWPDLRWLHDDVYDEGGMATRFGLHGITMFFVFQRAQDRPHHRVGRDRGLHRHDRSAAKSVLAAVRGSRCWVNRPRSGGNRRPRFRFVAAARCASGVARTNGKEHLG